MPKRGVVRFGKRGKLLPRFIGPFEILERIVIVAYRLALPPSMSSVHEVFHVPILRKYTPDPAHVVDWGQIEVDTYGTFEEGPVYILNSRVKVLRRKTVRLVRALWRHYGVEKSTWEREDTMRVKPRENPIVSKRGKIVISVKIRNFSRSRMMKRTSPLKSSRKI